MAHEKLCVHRYAYVDRHTLSQFAFMNVQSKTKTMYAFKRLSIADNTRYANISSHSAPIVTIIVTNTYRELKSYYVEP